MSKKISLLFIVLLILGWYTAMEAYQNNTEDMYQKHMEQAAAYEAKKIYEDAIVEYEAAQNCLEKPDIMIDLKIAQAYLEMEERRDYEDKMEEVIDTYKNNAEAVLELARYYVENKKVPKAVTILKDGCDLNPDSQELKAELDLYKGTYTSVYTSYEQMLRIVNGYTIVQKGEYYGVINNYGDVCIAPKYEKLGIFGTEDIPYAPVYEENQWFYVNNKIHRKLVPDEQQYDLFTTFSEGKAVAIKDGKYGYVGTMLEELCDFEYENASYFYNGVAAVKKAGKWALINGEMEPITEFIYEDIKMDEYGYCSVGERVFAKQNGAYQMLNLQGEVVSELVFEDVYPFVSEEPAAVQIDGKWGFVSQEGQLVIECSYENAKSFEIGFAPVMQQNQWGYIDGNNKLAIDYKFEDAQPFYMDGTAPVLVDGNWNIIKLNLYQ